MRDLQGAIATWSQATFPQQSAYRLAKHLAEELAELNQALDTDGDSTPNIAEEIADCLILLMCLASYCGIDARDAVEEKHRVNLQRVYRFDPELGYDRKVS